MTWENDVAILVLDTTSEGIMSDRIAPISLATSHYRGGESATVSGWGTLQFGGNYLPAALALINRVFPRIRTACL